MAPQRVYALPMRSYFPWLLVLSLAACSDDDGSAGSPDAGDASSGDGDSGDGDSGDGDSGDGDAGDGDSGDAGSGDGDTGDGDSGDGDSGDGDSADAGPAADAGTPPGRCQGQSYTTAPSGAPCDVSLFTFRSCAGPGVGQFCDTLGVTLDADDEAPEGFTCEQRFDGKQRCEWRFPEGGHNLDEAAVEGACAQTVAEPPREVECIVYEG